MKTSNGPILGTFNTSHYLELHTSNSPVKVDVGLLSESDDERTPTKLSIESSNGYVRIAHRYSRHADALADPSLRT